MTDDTPHTSGTDSVPTPIVVVAQTAVATLRTE